MKLYDLLQLSVCVFSVLAAGFWLQSATNKFPKLARQSQRERHWPISNNADKPITMERSGCRVRRCCCFFSIARRIVALWFRLKLLRN